MEDRSKIRYTIQLKNEGFSTPVVDAQVQLINKKTKEVLFETRTDNTGKAELWYDLNNLDTIKAKPNPIKTPDTSTSSALMLTPNNFVGLKKDPLECMNYDDYLNQLRDTIMSLEDAKLDSIYYQSHKIGDKEIYLQSLM